MADMDRLTTEEMNLRRRARRRLVGAIALALLAAVVLPMLFDPEPKPLGPEVDIRIPDQSTPFEPGLPAPHTPIAEVEDNTASQGSAPSAAQSLTPPPAAPPASPVTASSRPAPAPDTELPPTTAKPVTQAGTGANTPSARTAKTPPPASETFAARGYFLQLGAFTSEANARQLADQAQTAGFNVVVQEAGGQFRVRLGPYAERKRALEMQAKLRAKGFGPILLGP